MSCCSISSSPMAMEFRCAAGSVSGRPRRARERVTPQAGAGRADRDRIRAGFPARRGLMARRIMLGVLALIVALLGIIVVPLGLITAGQDRRDFQAESLAAPATLAHVA